MSKGGKIFLTLFKIFGKSFVLMAGMIAVFLFLALVSSPAAEAAAPTGFTSQAFQDSNADGRVDQVAVVINGGEALTACVVTDAEVAADWVYTPGSLGGALANAGNTHLCNAGTATITLKITGANANMTAAAVAPTIAYNNAGVVNSIANATGNLGAVAPATAADGAAPVYMASQTLDNNNDGTADFVKVTYSEPISDASVAAGDFQAGIANTGAGNLVEAFASATPSSGNATDIANDNMIYVGVASGTETISANRSDYRLKIQQVGAVSDAAANALAVFASQDSADGAKPIVSSATAFTDRILINFSENVDGMAAMNCANYAVNGSAVVCSGPGTPFIDFQGNKTTIRGLNLAGTASLSIAGGNTINDINGGNNTLAAYNNAALAVNPLVLPAISGISPVSGAVGAAVTITGTNFGTTATPGDATHKVFFSGGFNPNTGPLPPIEADYTGAIWAGTSISVKVPAGAQGGPVNVMANGVMSDMGPNSFFDIAANFTFKIYYDAPPTALMPDGDNGNIRVFIGGPNGENIYRIGDGIMTYNAGADTFTIANISSMGFMWAYDITGNHLSSPGRQIDVSSTQNISLVATTRKISGTLTMGNPCAAAGQNKNLVVFAMPENINFSDNNFKEVEPVFFTTNGACTANYVIGVPINGTYRVEGHVPPDRSSGIVVSSPFTPPNPQTVTITDAAQTASNINFAFSAATHRIVGTVQKPAGGFGAEERGMLWVFAYQPKEGGKGTGTQVNNDGTFTLYVTPGVWKLGVGGPNMPFPVEVQVDVDNTYELADPAKGPTIIISPPSDFIEGYVKDAAGNGLANASIYAWREGGPGNGNAKTDSQGYYKMYVTPGAGYHVGAHSQTFGFLGEQSNIAVSSSVHPTVNFSVNSGNNFTISGTVTKGGVGLQQAFVFMTDGENGAMLGSGGTDGAGAYALRVSGGNRWIHVGLPGKGEIYKENMGNIAADNNAKNIAITSSIIRVRISPSSDFTQAFVGAHSAQGEGFADTDVSSEGPDTYREYQIEVPRPAAGGTTYYIEGGIPGFGPLAQAAVTVNSDGTFAENNTTGAGNAANDGLIGYALAGLYTVSGTVTGDNVRDAWVWANGPNGGGGGAVAADGTYSFKLRNGTYDLGVGKPDYIGNKLSITVNNQNLPNQNLVLTTAALTIAGKVYLPDGVTTVTNAWVWAENGAGGWAGGSTNANGDYTLRVGAGDWTVKAAFDGYASTGIITAAPAAARNITLAAISGFSPNQKNTPITPSEGGVVQGTGVKLDFPKNTLGQDTSAGTVEVRSTTNVPTKSSVDIVGTAKEITARNSSNQTITTITGSINVELNLSKQELQADNLTLAQAQNLKISYFDSTTGGNWVEIPTVVTLSNPAAATINDLNNDVALTLSGAVSHLSAFAPTSPTDADAPLTPGGFSALAGDGQAVLSWTASVGAVRYYIYRQAGNDYPYLGQTTGVSYIATGLANGTAYSFKVSAVDSLNRESAATAAVSATPLAPTGGGGGGGTTANADTTPPTNISISIAVGAASAANAATTLTLTATDANQMMISNISDFTGGIWETYAASKSWTLTSGDGTKTVYAKFKDAAGNISAIVSDTITLSGSGTTGDINTAVPTASPTATPISSYADGTLIKSASAPEVYVIKNGKKVWIPSAEEFNKAGYSWSSIITAAKSALDAYAMDTASSIAAVKVIVVTAPALRVRNTDSASGKMLGLVRKGDNYSVLEEKNGWYKIKSAAGVVGWVSGAYTAVKSETAATAETSASSASASIIISTPILRVRSQGSISGAILGSVRQGDNYTLIEEKNGWYKIKLKSGNVGWISGLYAVKQ